MKASLELPAKTSVRDLDLSDRVVDRRDEFKEKWDALFSTDEKSQKSKSERVEAVSLLMED